MPSDLATTATEEEVVGHADLSTVSRYAHVAAEELHSAAALIAAHGGLAEALPADRLLASQARGGAMPTRTPRRRPGARAERFQRNRREAA